MKKTKSLLAVTLSVLVIFLSGCSTNFLKTDADANDTNKEAIYEIEKMSGKATTYLNVDINGNLVLFLSFLNENAYDLTLYDAQYNKIIAERNLADVHFGDLWSIAGAKFYNENQIIVYNNDAQKGILYDLNLNRLDEVDYTPEIYYDREPVSEMVDSSFDMNKNYAISYLSDKKVCVFDDEPETAYVLTNSDSRNLYEKNKIFLSAKDDESGSTDIFIDDYKSGTRLYKTTIKNNVQNVFNCVELGCFNDDYACVIVSTVNNFTGGSVQRAYIWNYKNSRTDETLNLVKGTNSDFEQENKEYAEKLKEKYGFDIYFNDILGQDYGYTIDTNASPVQSYLFLTTFENCLKIFPDNFIRETYQGENLSNKFNICIVNTIENANAFAISFKDEYRITYSAVNSDKLVIYHELMHIIENRISDYYDQQGSNLYDLWYALNGDNGDNYSEEYFISNYAATNYTEDMAETFQYLIDYAEYIDDSEEIVSLRYEAVRKKAEFLCQSIRKAFPSAENAENLVWEKHINI